MNETALNDVIPSVLEKVVQNSLAEGEKILVRLTGAQKGALVCTDRRIMIAKSGFMAGLTFGSDIFQLPYGSIASAEVKYRIMSGYFEISAGGMQNTAKSYWSSNKASDPAKAPNCVALNSKQQAARFRSACAFIMARIEQRRHGTAAAPFILTATDIATSLERLWKLKEDGAISQTEYDTAKARLLIG